MPQRHARRECFSIAPEAETGNIANTYTYYPSILPDETICSDSHSCGTGRCGLRQPPPCGGRQTKVSVVRRHGQLRTFCRARLRRLLSRQGVPRGIQPHRGRCASRRGRRALQQRPAPSAQNHRRHYRRPRLGLSTLLHRRRPQPRHEGYGQRHGLRRRFAPAPSGPRI